MLAKFSWDAAWSFLNKTWPVIISVLLVITLVVFRLQLQRANEKLAGEATFRQVVQTELGAPDAKIETLIITVRERVKESADRKAALTRISTETVVAKKRADVADAALKKAQLSNAKKFAAAKPLIKKLNARKPTGDLVKDTAALDEDSKAAWKGWK